MGDRRWSTRSGACTATCAISVTDRCNFRCTYCMPAEGMPWLPRAELLTYEEIDRLAPVFVERFGFDGIRLTGGEPTVRAHLPVLVERLSQLRTSAGEPVDLALTTNGATLRLIADDLAARRAAPHQHLAATRCAASASPRSPSATRSTRCSTASTPRSTPGSTR